MLLLKKIITWSCEALAIGS